MQALMVTAKQKMFFYDLHRAFKYMLVMTLHACITVIKD